MSQKNRMLVASLCLIVACMSWRIGAAQVVDGGWVLVGQGEGAPMVEGRPAYPLGYPTWPPEAGR